MQEMKSLAVAYHQLINSDEYRDNLDAAVIIGDFNIEQDKFYREIREDELLRHQ